MTCMDCKYDPCRCPGYPDKPKHKSVFFEGSSDKPFVTLDLKGEEMPLTGESFNIGKGKVYKVMKITKIVNNNNTIFKFYCS